MTFRCTCGLEMPVGDNVPPACRICPACGGRLTLSFRSGAGGEPIETVPIPPCYPPDVAPAAESLGYRVIEVPGPPSKNQPAKPAAEVDRYYPVDTWSDAYRARNEFEEREVKRIMEDARREWRNRRPSRRWPLEENGFECFIFPLRCAGRIMALSVLWATLTLIVILALPTPDSGRGAWLLRLPYAVFPLALLGVTWNLLRDVLHSGAEGSREFEAWNIFDLRAIAQSALMAVLAFLAGPVLLVAAALWFWINAGTLEVIDQLVLWQLGLCACVGWVYLLVALDARERLTDLSAAGVARLVARQGWPGWVFPITGGVSLALFSFLLIQTWLLMPESNASVWVSHIFLWLAALSFWTFLLRWYGLQRYWRRQGSATGQGVELRRFDAAWGA
jgi:hypothetical protein